MARDTGFPDVMSAIQRRLVGPCRARTRGVSAGLRPERRTPPGLYNPRGVGEVAPPMKSRGQPAAPAVARRVEPVSPGSLGG